MGMQVIKCNVCGGSIPSDCIDVMNKRANCPFCGTTHTIQDTPPAPPASDKPLGVILQNGEFKCQNCGHSLRQSEINKDTLVGTCEYCGSMVTATRKQANATKEVLHSQENAVRFFLENNFDSARHYAEELLSCAVDNAVGLYIIAYYKAYKSEVKTRSHLDKFFKNDLSNIDFTDEEVEGFKKVILHSLTHVADYEKEILAKLLECQSPNDLADFVDAFSPYLVAKRGTIDWFDTEMCDVYTRVTSFTNIPKTWYALYTAIIKNPDSPEASDTYYLKTKTARFYNDFVLGIGRIFEQIKDEALKAKFNGAFCKIKEAINKKMN